MAKQQPILFENPTDPVFDTYIPGPNSEVIAHLQEAANSPENVLIYLWGASRLGKSHLLHATAHLARNLGHSVFILDLQHDPDPKLECLEGLEQFSLLCIDNIDHIAGRPDWEEALFGLFNQLRDSHAGLCVTASAAPDHLGLQLQDLKTRLSWGLQLKLKDLDDQQKIQAITLKATQRGFEINAAIGQYLLNHFSRDLPALWDLLDVLDHETLAEKRKLTLPFLKQILEQRQ